MFQRLFRWLSGWSESPPWPNEDTLLVFGHTSYFDILVLWLYQDKNTWTLIRPLPFHLGPILKPLLDTLGLIEAGSIHESKNGTTDRIITQLVQAKLNKPDEPIYFLMSPKGTVANRPWRSGYYHIAKTLNFNIQAVQADFCTRTIGLGPVRSTDDPLEILTDQLQYDLGFAVPFRPENCEYELHKPEDPFELLSLIDLPFATMWFSLPALWNVFWNATSIVPILIASLNIFVSFVYHQTREQHFAALDATTSRMNIAMALAYANHFDLGTLFIFSLALCVYFAGTPRHFEGSRGRYVVYHSLFHVLASLSAYRMYADTTHHRSNVLFLE